MIEPPKAHRRGPLRLAYTHTHAQKDRNAFMFSEIVDFAVGKQEHCFIYNI